MNLVNFKRYQHSKAVTDFKEFAGRTHWITVQERWEEVADYIAHWLKPTASFPPTAVHGKYPFVLSVSGG
jgi:hypothetical protein